MSVVGYGNWCLRFLDGGSGFGNRGRRGGGTFWPYFHPLRIVCLGLRAGREAWQQQVRCFCHLDIGMMRKNTSFSSLRNYSWKFGFFSVIATAAGGEGVRGLFWLALNETIRQILAIISYAPPVRVTHEIYTKRLKCKPPLILVNSP